MEDTAQAQLVALQATEPTCCTTPTLQAQLILHPPNAVRYNSDPNPNPNPDPNPDPDPNLNHNHNPNPNPTPTPTP